MIISMYKIEVIILEKNIFAINIFAMIFIHLIDKRIKKKNHICIIIILYMFMR